MSLLGGFVYTAVASKSKAFTWLPLQAQGVRAHSC